MVSDEILHEVAVAGDCRVSGAGTHEELVNSNPLYANWRRAN
jgi:hypothetical protein